jgi:hypothetical protein
MLRCIKGCRKRFGRAEASRAYRYLNRETEQGFGGDDEHVGGAQFTDAMSDVVVDSVPSPVLEAANDSELLSPSNSDAHVSDSVDPLQDILVRTDSVPRFLHYFSSLCGVRLISPSNVPLIASAHEEDQRLSNTQVPAQSTAPVSLSLTDEGLEDPLMTLDSVSDTGDDGPLISESAEPVSIRDPRLPSVLFEHTCKINARDEEQEARCSFTLRADVDGYRIFLKSGVRLQQFIKVRYCLQKFKYLGKTSVSVKITDDGERTCNRRVHGDNMLIYRLGKVEEFNAKLYICMAFLDNRPEGSDCILSSINSCVIRALRESTSAAPTIELAEAHRMNHGPKEIRVVDPAMSYRFLNYLLDCLSSIVFPNRERFKALILIERFGQKDVSPLIHSAEHAFLLRLEKSDGAVQDGSVDIGIVFKPDANGKHTTCLWARQFLQDTLQLSNIHGKSLLFDACDATVDHSKSGEVRREKFYSDEVYLWRRHAKIPYLALDQSCNIWKSIPHFVERLDPTTKRSLDVHGVKTLADLKTVQAFSNAVHASTVSSRYEITVSIRKFEEYARIVQLLVDRSASQSIRKMFVILSSADYGRFIGMTVDKLRTLSASAAHDLHSHLMDQSRTLLPSYCRGQAILCSADVLLLRLVCIEDHLILFLTGDFFYLRHRSAMHFMGYPAQLKRNGHVGALMLKDFNRFIESMSGCPFNFAKFMYGFLYPAIRKVTDPKIRLVHINRACNWLESCLLASLPSSTVSSVAFREAVCRKAVHLLIEEAQDIVKCAIVSPKVGPSMNVLTKTALESTGMKQSTAMSPRSYMMVSLSSRLSKSSNVTQRLSASSLLSIAVGTTKTDFTKIVAQAAKFAEDHWESYKSQYGLTHLPLFDGDDAGGKLPASFVEVTSQVQNQVVNSLDMATMPVSDLGRGAEVMGIMPWMIEGVKKRIITVFRPSSGPTESHVRIVEAFYFLLQVQVGLIQSYEPAKAAMKRLFAAKITKSSLLSLAVFHNSCFLDKQCRQWKLVPLNVLKRLLSAELADPQMIRAMETESAGRMVVPDFHFGPKWLDYARHVLTLSPTRQRGRPRRSCVISNHNANQDETENSVDESADEEEESCSSSE